MLFKIIASILLLIQPTEIVIDKIAAVVNNEIITISDIDKALFFYSSYDVDNNFEGDLYLKELKKMIDYKVIFLEFKDQFELNDGDFENMKRSIIERFGSFQNMVEILNKFDMDMSGFRNFLTEKVFYDKVIKDKFKLGIIIEFSAIENFYNKKYLLTCNRLKIEPKSIIEMTPVIESFLREKKVKKELVQWMDSIRASYSITNILSEEKGRRRENERKDG